MGAKVLMSDPKVVPMGSQDHEISSDLIVVFTIYKVSEMVLSQRENENPTFLQNVICFRASQCEIYISKIQFQCKNREFQHFSALAQG